MFSMEKAYMEILDVAPREGMDVVEDRAFNFLSAKKAEYRKMLNHLTDHDKEHNTAKKLKGCYQAICLSLTKYKNRRLQENVDQENR